MSVETAIILNATLGLSLVLAVGAMMLAPLMRSTSFANAGAAVLRRRGTHRSSLPA